MISSGITIVNKTEDAANLAIAVYQVLENRPNLDRHIWRIVRPALGGRSTLIVPERLGLYVEYVKDCVRYRTNTVEIVDNTGYLCVQSAPGRTAHLEYSAKPVRRGQVIVDVDTCVGRAVNVVPVRGGRPVCGPLLTSPGMSRLMTIQPVFFLAKIYDEADAGSQVQALEMQSDEVPVVPGQSACVRGSIDRGYSIDVSDKTGM